MVGSLFEEGRQFVSEGLDEMLDFRSKMKSKKPYGPEVSRWLWLGFFLVLALMVAEQAMHPEAWQFLVRGLFRDAQRREEPIDNRLTPKEPQTPPGAILVAKGEEVSQEQSSPAGLLPKPPLSDAQLEAIQDDSPLRRAEMEAWRRLFQVLHETEEADLRKRSEGIVSYGQLFQQSKAYRGRLVTVRGQLRRALRAGMPQNPWGQEHYYQTWLQPADQPANPMQIYCLQLPEGFPLGMEIDESVEITGFYFKRAAYQAQDGLRTTPTLAAKTVRWLPRQSLAPNQEPLTGAPLVVLLVVVGLLGVAAAAAMYYRVQPKQRFEVPKIVDFHRLTRQVEKEESASSEHSAQTDSSDS